MSWIDNLIKYSNSGKVGKCPKCGSEQVKVTEHKYGNKISRKSVTFTCELCGSFDHFDGGVIEETHERFREKCKRLKSEIEMFDTVLLKDGRKATIVEIFEDSYVADIEIAKGEYDTDFITQEQIEKVLK